MRALRERIEQEPALVAGAVQAGLACLVAFGVPLTDAQQGAVLALSAALLALFVRNRSTPLPKPLRGRRRPQVPPQ